MNNIIITGGETFNKGAQSMSFILISELKNRFPGVEIILMSYQDYMDEEKDQYNFTILPYQILTKLYCLGGIYALLARLSKPLLNLHKKLITEKDFIIREKLRETMAIFDISGYGLSSQIGYSSSIPTVVNIMVAKKYSIPIFFLPQSFGPFDFKGLPGYFFNRLLRKHLSYPKIIFAREEHGLQYLKKYTSVNVEKQPDIVIQYNKNYDLNAIYARPVALKETLIKPNSIGIIPNQRIFNKNNEKSVFQLYAEITIKLRSSGKHVYLLRHSFEDLIFCKKIKESFPDDPNVIILDNDFSCIEIHNIINKFELVIASRYHSVVHAYKNAVPAIILGWAVKYIELAKAFKQDRYVFDINTLSSDDSINNILESVELLLKRIKTESSIIHDKINEITQNNFFNYLFECADLPISQMDQSL